MSAPNPSSRRTPGPIKTGGEALVQTFSHEPVDLRLWVPAFAGMTIGGGAAL
jgi:hypothetical protein